MIEEQNDPPKTPPRDPYPRMIIVCIVITAVLLFGIFAMLLVDYVIRSAPNSPPPDPAAFEQMLEQPRDAYDDATVEENN